MSTNSQSTQPEKEVILASQLKPLLLLLFSLFFISCGTLLINTGPISDNLTLLIIIWGAVLICSAGAPVMLAVLILRIPKIELSCEGISYVALFRKKIWNWRDIGPFVSDIRQVQNISHHYICAFSDENHDLMQIHNQSIQPDYLIAEIVISLNLLPPGKNSETAAIFADKLNEWREKYGAPEIEVNHQNTKEAAAKFLKKIRNRKIVYYVTVFVCVIIAAFLLEDPLEILEILRYL
ncbi:MAG: hypothetical protein JKX94_05925 [Sneathiella sp.]|nr:hypothetical protein [Sneathiella sp.]